MTDNKELIVNFSGGKDSTAMLHLLLEHGEHVDEVIYFDGGWEFPQMADHVALVEEKTGIKITRLYPPEGDFDWYTYKRPVSPKNKGVYFGFGYPGINMRWCTRFKVESIQRYLKGRNVVHAIGFAVGEERRAVRQILKNDKECVYPLLEYNYDEQDCLDYCYELGYTWDGLYKYLDRVSCFCCPYTNKKEMLKLKRHFPEIWQMIKDKDVEVQKARKQGGVAKWSTQGSFDEIDASIRGRDEEWNPAEWIEKLNIKQKPIQIEPIDNSPTLFDDND